jgi:2-oxoacid:acceptor oxidoreductase gamma subunit (pyruvate/2-ketoisovalerate family)
MHQLKFYGIGGQGVVTAAKILSHAASIHENRYARTIPAFGHERRGAPVFSDVMIDGQPILLSSFVYEPDVVMVFATSVIDRGIAVAEGIHDKSILVINTEDTFLVERLAREYIFSDIYYVGATRIALEQIGKDIPNGAMLGAFARTGIVGIDSITRSLEEIFTGREGGRNARAARRAFENTRKR